MSKPCKELMNFVCKFGTYVFEVMLFGLVNAFATCQKAMDKILDGLPFVLVYLDNILIFLNIIDDHL